MSRRPTYQIVGWHEGLSLAGKQPAYDAFTEHSVQRPFFAEPKPWEKSVSVGKNQLSTVNLVISNK